MSSTTNDPFVRLYQPSDKANVSHVFRETADASVQAEPICTIGCHIWCLPYLTLSPSTCFVLDDGSGQAVGYCIGTPDTTDFAERWRDEYVPTIEQDLRKLPPSSDVDEGGKKKLQERQRELCDGIYSNPRNLVYGEIEAPLKDYPGHLHIDILPSHQRRGYGKKLIEALLQSFKDAGCKGLYLGMVAANADAARFYEREGFYRLPHVLDDGASGEKGRTSGTIYYVKDL